jgi:hypothetical protein
LVITDVLEELADSVFMVVQIKWIEVEEMAENKELYSSSYNVGGTVRNYKELGS